MGKQRFLNNFDTQIIASVKASPTTGTPNTELDYGIVRVSSGAAAALGTLSDGDFYVLTAYKKSGTVESNREVWKVTSIDTSVINETRLTVSRAQEGTTAQSYVAGDYVSMRLTAAGLGSFMPQKLPALFYFNSGTTNAIDVGNGTHQRWAPSTGAQTLTITGWPASGYHGELMIEGVNLGAATITWPTINWVKPDGTFTTSVSTYLASNGVTLQSSGIDWIVLWTRDGGTTVYGAIIR